MVNERVPQQPLLEYYLGLCHVVNTLRPRQNSLHFPDDIFKCIFLNENVRISLKISLKFVPTVRINNYLTLAQIMAWHHPGNNPQSEAMMVSLPTHICITRPQWVKSLQFIWWSDTLRWNSSTRCTIFTWVHLIQSYDTSLLIPVNVHDSTSEVADPD